LAKLKPDSACKLADFKKPASGGSFSRREKVRMRGNATIPHAAIVLVDTL
jgi:hypothetical protein